MIGGKVIEVAKFPPEARDGLATHRVWVIGVGQENGMELAVNVYSDSGARLPHLGESVWWQKRRLFFGGPDRARGEVSVQIEGTAYDPRDVINRCPA